MDRRDRFETKGVEPLSKQRSLIALGVALGVVVVVLGAVQYALRQQDAPAMTRYPVTWQLTAGQTLTAQSTSVDVEVDDDRCADGVPASQRLRPAKMSYGDQTVTIALTAELSAGFHTCPGSIGPGIHTVRIRLDEPLGARRLVDGHAGTAWP